MNALPDLPRRNIDELIALYEFEPCIRDVYSEGHSDKTILRWFIDASCSQGKSVGIYPIDEIDVPIEVLNKYGLTSGNRSEVIALCLELEAQLGQDFTRATGVIDKDTDGVFGQAYECSLLLKSDYSCIEMYLFSEKSFGKMLKLAFSNIKYSAEEIVAQLAPVLRELFLTRAANQSLALAAKWIAFDGFISQKNGIIQFQSDNFRRHYLQNGGVWDKRTEFETEIETLRSKLPGDFRLVANGHDAICLLSHFLKSFYKKTKDKDRTAPHVLIHILTCSSEIIEFQEQPMFKRLVERLAATPI